MKGFKLALSLITGLLAVCVLTAASAEVPLPSGWYIEGNAGGFKSSNVSYLSNTSGSALNINGGYKFMPFFAAEIGYTKYADITAKANGIEVAQISHYSYDLVGKGILPIGTTGAELFAKLGVGRINSKVSQSNSAYVISSSITGSHNVTGYYFGLGGDYSFMPNVAVNGQWQRAKGDSRTGNLDLYSIGVSYLFG